MEPLKGYLRTPKPVQSRLTERGQMMDKILCKINPGRVKDGYAPLTHGRLARLLKGISKSRTYQIIALCDEAERKGLPWGAIFWKEVRRTSL